MNIFDFLKVLEEREIYYRLNRIRDSILIEIAVPDERWEVEFFENGDVEIEKFLSNGKIYNQSELEILFKNFSD